MSQLWMNLDAALGPGRDAAVLTFAQISLGGGVIAFLEDLRLHGNVEHVSDVALAVFERNGHITVVPKRR